MANQLKKQALCLAFQDKPITNGMPISRAKVSALTVN